MRDEIPKPMLQRRPEVCLPYEEDRENPSLIESRDPASRRLRRGVLVGEAAMGINGYVGGLARLELPFAARLADVEVHERFDALPTGSEVPGGAKLPVARHVDDKRGDFTVTQGFVRRDLNPPMIHSQRG